MNKVKVIQQSKTQIWCSNWPKGDQWPAMRLSNMTGMTGISLFIDVKRAKMGDKEIHFIQKLNLSKELFTLTIAQKIADLINTPEWLGMKRDQQIKLVDIILHLGFE